MLNYNLEVQQPRKSVPIPLPCGVVNDEKTDCMFYIKLSGAPPYRMLDVSRWPVTGRLAQDSQSVELPPPPPSQSVSVLASTTTPPLLSSLTVSDLR